VDAVSPGATVDGRTLRAERTRRAVAAAYLDLLTDGDLRPTADRIAERAGVSPRSVFKHFPDREALFGEVAELQERRVREMLGDLPDPAAPLVERLDAFVDQRARFHEFIAPVRRAALLSEPFSDIVASRLKLARAAGAAIVDHVFATELAERDRRGRADLHDALCAIAAWPTWESLRRHQGLSAARAKSVLRAMLAAQLKAE
jgi:TetR/AcrR family transcriptional regulator, regulator of autoinduction and epiphytic fitness